METNTNRASDVLHSSNSSKLSPEEIAKAVARHNRHHPGTKTAAPAGKLATRDPGTGNKPDWPHAGTAHMVTARAATAMTPSLARRIVRIKPLLS